MTVPQSDHFIRKLLLPELVLLKIDGIPGKARVDIDAQKCSAFEVCPRCATPSSVIYDHRWVVIKDAPMRDKHYFLNIRKRRFLCKSCQKPFTEPVAGIKVKSRTTERFKKHVLWACENFSDLTAVRRACRCSTGFIYKALYQMLELQRRRHTNYPWPEIIGIDEHFFKRNQQLGTREFASVLVDIKGRRIRELVQGRSVDVLHTALHHIPGRENVKQIVMDLCATFRSFAHQFFPNASITADKFHVIRLLHPAINRHRKAITGDKRALPLRRLLLCNGYKLNYQARWMLQQWLIQHPQLHDIYQAKEAIHRLYRMRSPSHAEKALTRLTDRLAHSQIPELKTLRRTLLAWRVEILNYFKTRLTNGMTEGFNNKAKLVKRRAYGYKSFQNYRLRLLNACA